MRDPIVYEFADIRVDLPRLSATRAGAAIPLEPKAFDVLMYLLAHRDRLVTKDELLDSVWAGTFVTPNVLTRVIAQIRKGLGDESQDARYIETVAKRGYRFIAPVTVHGDMTEAAGPSSPPPPDAAGRRAPRNRTRAAVVGLALFGLAAAGAGAALLFRASAGSTVEPEIHLQRLTNRRGFSGTPSLSPDGRAIVYSSDAGGSLELYVTGFTPGGAEMQLTHDGGLNIDPAWSPDGQWIAFHSRKRGGVWVVPATGGTPQQVIEFGSDPAWSPDSSTLVFTSDSGGLAGQSSLWTVKRDGSGRKEITKVGAPPGGHRAPAWSHDGRLVAFIVTRGGWRVQIWLLNLATGEPRLVETTTIGSDPSFAASDRALYWGGATATGNGRVFRRSLDANGQPAGETETVFPMDSAIVEGIALAPNGALVFSARTIDANLWAIDLGADGRPHEPVRLTDDVARATYPDVSADGRIVYQELAVGSPASLRVMNEDGSGKSLLISGTPGIYPEWDATGQRVFVARINPENLSDFVWVDFATRRISPVGLRVGDMLSTRLSPDSTALAFHRIDDDGRLSVWTTSLDGKRTRVATDPEAVSYPTWSPDGKWLAVEIKRGDSTHIGLVASGGGPVTQLTDARGQSWPQSWAPDNDRIAFAGQRDGIWNIYTVSRSTREVAQLTFFTSATGYVRYPEWSRTRPRIVFERSSDSASLWLANGLRGPD